MSLGCVRVGLSGRMAHLIIFEYDTPVYVFNR